jgi:DNA-binding LacI/PurR family transcriptional regulator
MQPVFEKHGITTRLERTRMGIGEAEVYARDPAVSGLVLMGGIQDAAFVHAVQASGIPFIVVGSHMYPFDVNCVMPDYLNGTRQAVEHLAGGGRRCIGLVNGPGSTTSSAEKYHGYRLGLTLSGLSFDPTLVIASDFDAEAGYQQTRDLLQDQPIVDAIVFGMDDQALGGMRAIRESGRRIPDDVAVVGFYDHDVARFTEPPLTSVRIDWPSLGAVAASRLCMLMDAPDDQAWCVVKPTELIVRRSSEASDQTIHN